MPGKVPFRVVHVSGQDDGYPASELNHHSPTTTGWHSARFCLYPQDIALQMEFRARLKKIQILSHQYLIPTKIEFYIGDVPEDEPPMLSNARYTRLGYVSLSDNEKTAFRARELKSVHVDAVGTFIKLVVHKNYINRHNIYNQVGLVAVNLIGFEARPMGNLESYSIGDERHSDVPGIGNIVSEPDQISPLDDLAFDLYQDPEVAQIIRKLERKKQEAVILENFEKAKRIKEAILELQRVGELLSRYELEKRAAIDNEDYDLARLKKKQQEEYRLEMYRQLEIHKLLDMAGASRGRAGGGGSFGGSSFGTSSSSNSYAASKTGRLNYQSSHDQQPIPALRNNGTPPPASSAVPPPVVAEKQPAAIPPPAQATPPFASPSPYMERDQRPVKDSPRDEASSEQPEEFGGGPVSQPPEELTEANARDAQPIVDAFGLVVAQKAYSKGWANREDAQLFAYRHLQDETPQDKDQARVWVRGSTHLARKGINDNVQAVFKGAIAIVEVLISQFISNQKLSKMETAHVLDACVPALFLRLSDSNQRMREAAKRFIVQLSNMPEVKSHRTVCTEAVRPWKAQAPPKLVLGKVDVLATLYELHGLEYGLTLDAIMGICNAALSHSASDARQKAEQLVIQLYRDMGAPVRNYLPPDDDFARKNPKYRHIFEQFDRVDGRPSKEQQQQAASQKAQKKQEEITALQEQLEQLRSLAAERQASARNTPQPAAGTDDDELHEINKMCMFCYQKSERFDVEDGMDMHYFKECPMLIKCQGCGVMVEIATYTNHLLSECPNSINYSKCPDCQLAVPTDQLDDHIADSAHPDEPEDGMAKCPLCLEDVSAEEENAWREHLCSKTLPTACRANPRRLAAPDD